MANWRMLLLYRDTIRQQNVSKRMNAHKQSVYFSEGCSVCTEKQIKIGVVLISERSAETFLHCDIFSANQAAIIFWETADWAE